jgi:hypothetical protein
MKYIGPLATPITRAPSAWFDAIFERSDAESEGLIIEEKLKLLFAHYQLQVGDWSGLAMALAQAHVPGFKVIKKAGRPPEWTPEIRLSFDYDVLAYMRDMGKQVTLVQAIEEVAKVPRWSVLLKGKKIDALLVQFHKSEKRLAGEILKAFPSGVPRNFTEDDLRALRDMRRPVKKPTRRSRTVSDKPTDPKQTK